MGRRPGQTGWTLDIEPISPLQAWELLLERSWTRLTCLSIPRPGLCNPSLSPQSGGREMPHILKIRPAAKGLLK